MAAKVPQQKIDDCRELYLRYGGLEHDRIVAEMRVRGWNGFTKRNLYARTRGGRVTPGWPERFGWDGELFPAETPSRRDKKAQDRSARRARQQGRYTQRAKHLPFLSVPPAVAGGSARHTVAHATNSTDSTDSTDSTNSTDSTDSTNSPDSFHSWLKTLPGIWDWDWRHQIYLYERLRKVTDGTCKRLMILMPPRHGKSELVTVRYSAWRLRQDPSMNIILGSYNQSLANRFSRKIRRVLADDAGELRNADCGLRNEETEAEELSSRQLLHSTIGSTQNVSVSDNPHSAIRDPKFNGSPFPFTRQRPVNTVAEWETSEGGGLRAVGVGAGVTGYGADLIVIDDPVKSREQANSQRFREKLWDWFNDDLYTRLEPNGAIVLIQTRWHEDDLAGRLLKEMADGGEQWEIVSLPALAEGGEMRIADCGMRIEETEAEELSFPDELHSTIGSTQKVSDPENPQSAIPDPKSADPLHRAPGVALCPQRYDEQALEAIRARMPEHSFAALYQQRPVPQEGGVFKRAWFRNIVSSAPAGLKWKRGWDLAVSIKQTADYTAAFRVAYDREGNMYIDGGIRRRIGFPEQRRLMIERMRLEHDTEHGIELALHGRAVMQELRAMPNVRGRRFTGVAVRGDKQERALSWQNLAAEGRIRLVRGAWNKAFVDEVCSFPHGTHDDQIDAVSLAVSMHERKPSKLYTF